jgi:dTDP-4-amino-4,6-dideoxygalactose transaminase
VATAIAAEECGFQPYAADVDADSWMLDPNAVADRTDLDRIGVVVPVSPFGRPVAQEPWQRFQSQTGVPVAIDGAAAFDVAAMHPERYFGSIPTALSFHATKSFSTGEGGAVIATDLALAERISRSLNFGFGTSRESLCASINGKMSEYHAAIGLAEHDGWADKRDALEAVARSYRRESDLAGVGRSLLAFPDVSSCYVLFRAPNAPEAEALCRRLDADGIDYRFWYGNGLLHHAHFAAIAHDDTAVAAAIAPTVVGLPVAPDLPAPDIARIVSHLA